MKVIHNSASAAGLLFLLAALPSPSFAAVILVPGDQPTIQAGIDASVNGDTILVANGTYTGAGHRDIDFGGRDVVVRSAGGATLCSVDAQGAGRAFAFSGGETAAARLEGFTITGGTHATAGGGIYVANSSPTISACILTNNTTGDGAAGTSGVPGGDAGHGAGAYVLNGAPTFTGCSFTNNTTGDGGDGFVDAAGSGGSAGGHGGSGAGLYVTGVSTVILERCIVSGNLTGGGGQGGSSVVCVPPLSCQTFGEDGGDGGDGAGIFSSAIVHVRNSVIASNTTGPGAAAGFGIDPPLPTPGRGGNGAGWSGGLLGSSIRSATIVANRVAAAGNEGQPAGTGGGVDGTATIDNSIVWDNDSTQITPALAVTFSDVQGGYAGPGNIDADPLFVDAPNGNLRLLAGSPCVDTGDNTEVLSSTDLDGNPRIVDGDISGVAVVDMGAFEGQFITSDVGFDRGERILRVDGSASEILRVRYALEAPATVRLSLYDARGRLQSVLVDAPHDAGEHIVTWDGRRRDGRPVARGVYFLQLRAQHLNSVEKFVWLRR